MKPRPQNPKRHRVAVLGAGVMGRLHARVFTDLASRYELVGIYDVMGRVAEDVARQRGTTTFASESDAIRGADLVVVASPIGAHAQSVRHALEAGVNVLVEKPLCAHADEAHSLVRAVRPEQQLFVGHSERFNPVVRALRRLVSPGSILGIAIRRFSTLSRGRTREHSVILNLAVHDLDLASYLTGGPIELCDASGSGIDRARLVVDSASGARTRIWVDRTARVRERTIEVTTDDDFVFRGDLLSPRLVQANLLSGASEDVALDDVEPLVAQAESIADALNGVKGCAVATGADGARAIAIAERGVERLRSQVPSVSEAS